MPRIGPVADKLEDGAWRNRNFPDRLPPRRGERAGTGLGVLAVRRGGSEIRLEANCGMDHRARLEARRGMNDGTRLKARLGMDHPPSEEAVFGDDRQRAAAAELAAGDVGGADRVAQQLDQLQIQCGDDEAGGGFETHARQKQSRVPLQRITFDELQESVRMPVRMILVLLFSDSPDESGYAG